MTHRIERDEHWWGWVVGKGRIKSEIIEQIAFNINSKGINYENIDICRNLTGRFSSFIVDERKRKEKVSNFCKGENENKKSMKKTQKFPYIKMTNVVCLRSSAQWFTNKCQFEVNETIYSNEISSNQNDEKVFFIFYNIKKVLTK